MVKGLTQSENTEEGKDLEKQTPIKKMAIETYISIITLNVNVINVPTKRHRLAEWILRRPIYMLSAKKPTSDLKTHKD